MLIQSNTYQNTSSYEKGCMAISTTSSKPLEWQAAHNIAQQIEAKQPSLLRKKKNNCICIKWTPINLQAM